MFKNLTAVLEASGSSVEHIVKATVFLADMNDYNAMNELYRKQLKAIRRQNDGAGGALASRCAD